MEFKSQICTTVEQSKRLLELGLKKETADMMYITDKNVPDEYRLYRLIPEYYEQYTEYLTHIPAWSLSRLIELCEPIPISSDWLYRTDAYYENMIACIAWRISKEGFNPQFLEEKQ